MNSNRARHPRTVTNDGRWSRRAALVLISVLLSPAVPAVADGGMVVWTGVRLDRPSAVIVSPPAPRIGPIEIAWIGTPHPAATISARHVDGIEMLAAFEPERFADEHHAFLALEVPGAWSMRLDPDGEGPAPPVLFEVVVGDAVPPWRSLWPAIFAWVPMLAIGLGAAWRRTSAR